MNIVQVLLKVALLGSSWVLYLLISLSIISVGVVIVVGLLAIFIS